MSGGSPGGEILLGGGAMGVALAALLSGCATTSAPKGFLPTATEAQSTARGGWISVEHVAGAGEVGASKVEGELIALGEDSLFVLHPAGLAVVATADVTSAKLTGYDPRWGLIALWTGIGTLSTASHGVVLLLSAPVWLITGSLFASSASRAPQVKHPKSWQQFRLYARFPQGLPRGVDRASLKM
jgi:hypothetical protein